MNATAKRITVAIPAINAGFNRETIEATTVEFDRETGQVYLDGECIGRVDKGENTAKVGGNSRRGSAKYYAGVTAWKAHLPGSTMREDFDGDRYPAHYKRNSRKGAIAFLLTAVHGEPNAYFNWSK